MKEEYWLCSDGKVKPISELSEEHVRNILRKLIRENRIIKASSNNQRLLEETRDDITDYSNYLSRKDVMFK
jgi:hypothetical protein